MGGWALEVFKMACYVSFPVGAFYCFNRPELFFEQDVIDVKRKLYPKVDPEKTAEFKNEMREIQAKQADRELQLQMQLYEKKKSGLLQHE